METNVYLSRVNKGLFVALVKAFYLSFYVPIIFYIFLSYLKNKFTCCKLFRI